MTFQSAFLLWWFLPIAGFIIVLYLLKVRRKEVRVPAIFLFPPITTDVRANSLWQRLRFNWLMVLQLLAVLFLLLALARPMVKGKGLTGKTVVFVLDASASMKANDFKPNRFEEAKNRIKKWLNGLRSNDQTALILAMTEPKVIVPLTTDHQRLKQALRHLTATDAPSDIGLALRLASALTANRPNASIVFASDGSFPEVTDFSPGKAELVYESVGKSERNLGIVTLDTQRKKEELLVFIALRNFSRQPMKGVLNWFADGQLVNAHELSVQAQKAHGETLRLPATVRQVTVRWECADDMLASDDLVHWVGSGQETVKILLVSSGNFFLERALNLEPEVVLDKAEKLPDTESGDGTEGRYDIVVFDTTKYVPAKAKAIWLVSSADGKFVRRIGEVKQPSVIAWEKDHMVLRFVDLGATFIDTALKVKVADWVQPIVESKDTPLIVVGEQADKRWLFIGFSLMDSDFPLRVGFPIFVANALHWSVGRRRFGKGFTMKTETPISLTVPTKSVTLKYPGGKVQRLSTPDQLLILRDLNKVGVYELKSGTEKINFAVNLLNSDESDIAPKRAISLGGRTYTAHSQTISWRQLWKLSVLLVIIILAVEWIVYVRRS